MPDSFHLTIQQATFWHTGFMPHPREQYGDWAIGCEVFVGRNKVSQTNVSELNPGGWSVSITTGSDPVRKAVVITPPPSFYGLNHNISFRHYSLDYITTQGGEDYYYTYIGYFAQLPRVWFAASSSNGVDYMNWVSFGSRFTTYKKVTNLFKAYVGAVNATAQGANWGWGNTQPEADIELQPPGTRAVAWKWRIVHTLPDRQDAEEVLTTKDMTFTVQKSGAQAPPVTSGASLPLSAAGLYRVYLSITDNYGRAASVDVHPVPAGQEGYIEMQVYNFAPYAKAHNLVNDDEVIRLESLSFDINDPYVRDNLNSSDAFIPVSGPNSWTYPYTWLFTLIDAPPPTKDDLRYEWSVREDSGEWVVLGTEKVLELSGDALDALLARPLAKYALYGSNAIWFRLTVWDDEGFGRSTMEYGLIPETGRSLAVISDHDGVIYTAEPEGNNILVREYRNGIPSETLKHTLTGHKNPSLCQVPGEATIYLAANDRTSGARRMYRSINFATNFDEVTA